MSKSCTKRTPNITYQNTDIGQIGRNLNLVMSVPPFILLFSYLKIFVIAAWGYITRDFSEQVRQQFINKTVHYSAKSDMVDENGHLLLTIPNPNYISLDDNPQIGQYFVFFVEVKT